MGKPRRKTESLKCNPVASKYMRGEFNSDNILESLNATILVASEEGVHDTLSK